MGCAKAGIEEWAFKDAECSPPTPVRIALIRIAAAAAAAAAAMIAGCTMAGFRAPGAEHITPAMRNKLTARRGLAAPQAICISTDDDDDHGAFMPVAHGKGSDAQPAPQQQQARQRLQQQGRQQQQQDGVMPRNRPPGAAARAAPGAGGRQPKAKR